MDETRTATVVSILKERINWNTGVAAFFIVLSVVLYLLVPSEIAQPKLAIARTMGGFKPSLFPEIALIGLFGVSLWYFVASLRMKEKNLFAELDVKSLGRIGVAMVIFIGYAILFPLLGYLISTALMALALTLYLGTRKVLVLVLVVIVIPLVIYFMFTQLLMVSLPTIPFVNGGRYF